jgi:tetraacyldisaccharide 4'-kinase
MRLIEKVWFHQHKAKYWLVPLLLPFTFLFYCLSSLRRLFFRIGLFKAYNSKAPIIVVGNIGVGGNGKTPVVILLVEQCIKLGLKPGVISRGYGGKAPCYPYVLTDESTPKEAGDEPVLIYQRCQVPVAVGSNRVASAECLIDSGCNIIITDDGLQHYTLARTIELIIVDGKRLFGNGLLLPAGPLREGLWRLKKVDNIIVNGKIHNTNLSKSLNNIFDNSLSMQLKAVKVVNLFTKEIVALTTFIQKYPKVNAIAGIGDPSRFFTTLTEAHLSVINQKGFIDHHDFNQDDFNAFDDTLPLLMTEKDAVKCMSFAKDNYWYVPVDATLSDENIELIQQLINKCKS